MCPAFLPVLPEQSYEDGNYNKFNRFEKHSSLRYFYESEEFEAETVDERRLGLSYVKILNKIDSGEILIDDLGSKM